MGAYLPNPVGIQFELSNVCNALCSSCQRNTIDFNELKRLQTEGVNVNIENLPMKNRPGLGKPKYATKELITNIMTGATNIKEVQYTGTIDDPLGHKDLIGITDHLLSIRPDIYIGMHTNGSMRTPKYLKEFAEVLLSRGRGPGDHTVHFSIDGLEDTNHLYRKNCRWDKIMENAQAFIDAGGRASWQMLEFPWNKHQLLEARVLAKSMGFTKFKVRENKSPLLNNLDEYLLKNKGDMKKIRRYHQVLDSTEVPNDPIDCRWRTELKQYHLSYDGRLWPCCYFTSAKYMRNDEQRDHIDLNYDKNFNNLYEHTWDEVMEHPFFKEDLVDSWEAKQHGLGPKDRYRICSTTCSKRVAWPATNMRTLEDFRTGEVIAPTISTNIAVKEERQKNFEGDE